MLPLLFIACGVLPYHRPPAPLPLVEPAAVAATVPALSIGPTLEHVDRLLASTDTVDGRDRLVELRDLLVGVQLADPQVQQRVVRYAERVLAIEVRSQPLGLAESPMAMASTIEAVVETIAVEPEDALSGARSLLAAGKPLEALAALDPLAAEKGSADLQSQAIEAWVRSELEHAELALLAARTQPKAPDRRAALLKVREQLVAIRTRFPGHPSAADVGSRLSRVDAELAKP